MFRSVMSRRFLTLGLWGAVVFWAGSIFWLSSLSPRELPGAAFLFPDKVIHFVAFALGGWLTASALLVPPASSSPVTGRLLLAVVFVAAFGAFDEAMQMFTPGRTGGDLHDWIADFLGAVVGASLTLVTHARLERFVTRP